MIIIKNDKEIDLMRIAGRIVAETLLLVEKKVKPGITTAELDRIAEEFITKHGAIPSFKGLYGFPASLCISVNEQVVHGIPGGYVLKEGDIVSVDCGAHINGFHGDAARTFAVGNISEEANKLIKVTEESFFKGLEFAKVGNRLTDISHEIQRYVEASGFSVVRDFVEPMVNMGTYRVATLGDDWTVVSADKSLSAHYENTVVILPDGPEILTLIK